MEVFPIFIAVPILWITYSRFPLTTVLYVCIFLHALVLMLGGAYTYARVPLGFEVAQLLGMHRNPYDKIGHFVQGFVPALAAREILLRGDYVRGRKMLAFIVMCIVLAISAFYELIEWLAALALGQGADEFLGTQGDPWDTIRHVLRACRWHRRPSIIIGCSRSSDPPHEPLCEHDLADRGAQRVSIGFADAALSDIL